MVFGPYENLIKTERTGQFISGGPLITKSPYHKQNNHTYRDLDISNVLDFGLGFSMCPMIADLEATKQIRWGMQLSLMCIYGACLSLFYGSASMCTCVPNKLSPHYSVRAGDEEIQEKGG